MIIKCLKCKLKFFVYFTAVLGLLALVINLNRDYPYLKTETSAIFHPTGENDNNDPFSFKTPRPKQVFNIGTNSLAENVHNDAVDISAQRPVKDNSTLEDVFHENDRCVPTTYVKCHLETRPVTTTNTSFGIGMLRRQDWMSVHGIFNLSTCPHTNCYFQDANINESTSLVIVYIVSLHDDFKPVNTWPHQLYAALTWEAPPYIEAQLINDKKSFWNSQFNLTVTFRTDADIFMPYGDLHYKPVPVDQRPDYYAIARNKTKSVAWFVSNCHPPSKREKYVEEMQKIIDVDIFGKCGQPCPSGHFMCSKEIPVQYRFYLSFENSFCKDYVTEKFFKLFAQDLFIVPVVRGGFEYNRYLPSNTFINAADFKSPSELARYLKQLGEDPIAYSRYLENKERYDYKKRYNVGCQACTFLNSRKHERRIDDLQNWLVNDICHPPTDL